MTNKYLTKFVFNNFVFIFFLMLAFFEPDIIYLKFSYLDYFFKVILVISYSISLVIFFENFQFKKFMNLIIIFFLMIFAITWIEAKGICWNSTMTEYLSVVAMCIYVDAGLKYNFKKMLLSLIIILSLFIFINTVSVFLYPDGLYQIDTTYSYTKYWVLGHKNFHIRYILSDLVLIGIYFSIYNRKIRLLGYLMLVISLIDVVEVESTTGLVALICFVILIFIGYVWKRKFKTKIFNIFLFFSLIFAFILLFNIQQYFSYFIENILGKDLTLTSRVYIWNNAVDYIENNFFFGQGVLDSATVLYQLSATHPHSFYLNIFYQSGLFGWLFTCIIIYIASKKLAKIDNRFLRCFLFSFYFVVFLMGIVESMENMLLIFPLLLLGDVGEIK